MLANIDTGFLLGALFTLCLFMLLIISVKIIRTSRKIRRRRGSANNIKRRSRLTWLKVSAVLLAITSEVLIASLILHGR